MDRNKLLEQWAVMQKHLLGTDPGDSDVSRQEIYDVAHMVMCGARQICEAIEQEKERGRRLVRYPNGTAVTTPKGHGTVMGAEVKQSGALLYYVRVGHHQEIFTDEQVEPVTETT